MTCSTVSVVIPLFNCERYVGDCITSIVKGLRDNDELIVVDDGSSDKSATYATSALSNHQNTRLIRKENGGVSSARNVGIDAATGEYIMFVDADDILISGWRDVIDCVLQRSGDADIVLMARGNKCDSDSGIEDVIDAMIGRNGKVMLQAGMSAWSKLFKLAAVRQAGARFNESIVHGEDALFNIEVLLKSGHWAVEDASIYRYRMRGTSATHGYSERFLESNLVYLRELDKLLSGHPSFEGRYAQVCIERSFVESVFIYAKQLASSRDIKTIVEGSRSFYRNPEYDSFLSSVRGAKQTRRIVQINYFFAKHGLFAILACAYRIPLRFVSSKEKWVEI